MSAFKTIYRSLASTTTENIRQLMNKSTGRFNDIANKMNIIICENGKCLAEMKIEEKHTNALQTLHGGCSASIVDIATTCALRTYKNLVRVPSVSVDMHLTYLKAIGIDEEIVIDAQVLKVGKSMGYTTCEIRNKATGEVIVKGSHTKFMMRPK